MDRLTAQHRAAQLALSRATVRDLLHLWPLLDIKRLDATYPGWEFAVGTLIQRNRATSAGLAAAYYKAFRALDVGTAFTPSLAKAAPAEQIATSLRVSSVIAIKKAMERGEQLVKATEKAFVLSSGEASRLVLNGGRQTILDSLHADDKAIGWQRVPSSKACAFCWMLADRGAVYKEETAEFAAHGHCHCQVAPQFGSELRDVPDYLPTARTITDTDRARVHKWLAENAQS